MRWNAKIDEEPQGWVRHPNTHRYRTDGDPEREYYEDGYNETGRITYGSCVGTTTAVAFGTGSATVASSDGSMCLALGNIYASNSSDD
jgi:hypothetical protein